MEEEIIKDIEDLIKILDFTCESGKSKNADDIRTLLDLYNKEKEKNVEIKQKLEEKNIPIETLLAEFERLENIEDERDAIYEDYQDLGKEAYKLQEELEQEQDKNKKLEERQKKFDDGELFTAKQCKHFEKITKEYYIHKDKIKEKIEKITSNKQYNWVGTEWQEAEVVGLLEDLLEED